MREIAIDSFTYEEYEEAIDQIEIIDNFIDMAENEVEKNEGKIWSRPGYGGFTVLPRLF